MNKCSVCEKEIPKGATECSAVCNQEASRRFRAGPVADARSTFASAMRKMLQPKPRELQPQLEVPMIIVKHRWKRQRNEVSGSVVLGFNDKGIARVPDVGNNRVAVETYCRFSKGLAQVVTAEPKVIEMEAAPPETSEEKVGMLDVPVGMSEKEVIEKLEGAAKAVSEEVMTSVKSPAVKPAKKKPLKKKIADKKSKD